MKEETKLIVATIAQTVSLLVVGAVWLILMCACFPPMTQEEAESMYQMEKTYGE